MTERVLPIKNGFNYRELGGYPTASGATVKYRKIIRSAGLNELSAADQQYLYDYGVRVDMDFRSTEERSQQPDKVPAGVDYQFNPVLAEDETQNSKSAKELQAMMREDPENGYQHMLQVYRDMVQTTHAQDAYKQFFATLLANDTPDQAVLFHCAAGKDRTGMGAYFFLSALRVPDEVITQDYLLTNETSKDRVAAVLADVRKNGGNSTMVRNIEALFTVNADYLNTARHAIRNMSGDVQHYLRDVLTLSDGDIQDLRRLYLTTK
ncbi:tyrosine-protein phosphatase [Schleiferilactobacillus shenzhenensis]|uniref:Protein-tyrosine phosphatase n=1 Tax=Schleiferilactobacillus shenzhenensis LY-73 TaxID=1231336 RepID=U4TSW8_9LACO|nr:tyrosine-protein phosphatase [Schleiferilactobacillus shenzhenensis]ERL64572.1 protein-tyrosine phosphatase [Schleiferilactobacillus shenzhenensis LY-73]